MGSRTTIVGAGFCCLILSFSYCACLFLIASMKMSEIPVTALWLEKFFLCFRWLCLVHMSQIHYSTNVINSHNWLLVFQDKPGTLLVNMTSILCDHSLIPGTLQPKHWESDESWWTSHQSSTNRVQWLLGGREWERKRLRRQFVVCETSGQLHAGVRGHKLNETLWPPQFSTL